MEEGMLVCKVSVKGEMIKGIPTVVINQETYIEFDKFAQKMIFLNK